MILMSDPLHSGSRESLPLLARFSLKCITRDFPSIIFLPLLVNDGLFDMLFTNNADRVEKCGSRKLPPFCPHFPPIQRTG